MPRSKCQRPPEGWSCSRPLDHDGPCAAIPDDDQVTEEQVEYAEALGMAQPIRAFSQEQIQWLTRALLSGVHLETAVASTGLTMADFEGALSEDPALVQFVATTSARAEVMLVEADNKFMLERTRPERYGPILARAIEPKSDDDDNLFGGG